MHSGATHPASAGGHDLRVEAQAWLTAFEHGLGGRDVAALSALFLADCHWRDLLALTWDVQTVSGRDTVIQELMRSAERFAPKNFRIDPARTQPREVKRAGESVLEVLFRFDTSVGRCEGVVRLKPAHDGAPRQAWSLSTVLDALHGHEEQFRRPRSRSHTVPRDFRAPNWSDQRRADAAYEDRDPAVMVIGAGQAGLSVAARLRQLGIDTLMIDRHERVGDNWRTRYHALALHTRTHVNHLPYLPFPDTWPDYVPKDMLAGWFEYYAQAMELNVWCGTEFVNGRCDDKAQRWDVTLRKAGSSDQSSDRIIHPRHLSPGRELDAGQSGHPGHRGLQGPGDAFGQLCRRCGLGGQAGAGVRHRHQRA